MDAPFAQGTVAASVMVDLTNRFREEEGPFVPTDLGGGVDAVPLGGRGFDLDLHFFFGSGADPTAVKIF